MVAMSHRYPKEEARFCYGCEHQWDAPTDGARGWCPHCGMNTTDHVGYRCPECGDLSGDPSPCSTCEAPASVLEMSRCYSALLEQLKLARDRDGGRFLDAETCIDGFSVSRFHPNETTLSVCVRGDDGSWRVRSEQGEQGASRGPWISLDTPEAAAEAAVRLAVASISA
jgi:hypothetical protein